MLSAIRPGLTSNVPNPIIYLNGQTLNAAQLNTSFGNIYTDYNGSITNFNISFGAAIALSKLNLDAPALSLQALLSNSWGAGVTGDPFARITLTSNGYLTFGSGAATQDVGLQRSAVNTIRLFVPGGGTPILDMNTGGIINAGTITASSIILASPLPIAQGGTNAITAPLARVSLGAAASGINADITSLTNLTTPLPLTEGGTGLGTAQGANKVLGYNAANTAFEGKTITAGSGITVTPAAGSITIASSSGGGSGFGGSGADGAIVQGGASETTVRDINATTLATSGPTWTVVSGTVINTTSTFTSGSLALVVRTSAQGGAPTIVNSAFAGDGCGISGGKGSRGGTTGSGGGGGGSIGSGGNGAATSTSFVAFGGAGLGEGPTLNKAFKKGLSGSGGGGAEGDGVNSGGSGGNGGGNLTICSIGTITFNSPFAVSVVGDAGTPGSGVGTSSGGGGGSGGILGLFSSTGLVYAAGSSISVIGGAGGNATASGNSAAGGGGGGGGILEISPSRTSAATITVNGGAIGAGGTATSPAVAGTVGLDVYVPDHPSLPTLVMFYDGTGWIALGNLYKHRTGSPYLTIAANQFVNWLAAFYAKPGKFEDLRYALNNGEDQDIQSLCDKDMTEAIKKTGKCSAFESRPATCRYIGDVVYSNRG